MAYTPVGAIGECEPHAIVGYGTSRLSLEASNSRCLGAVFT